jgi:hypothetical protein
VFGVGNVGGAGGGVVALVAGVADVVVALDRGDEESRLYEVEGDGEGLRGRADGYVDVVDGEVGLFEVVSRGRRCGLGMGRK